MVKIESPEEEIVDNISPEHPDKLGLDRNSNSEELQLQTRFSITENNFNPIQEESPLKKSTRPSLTEARFEESTEHSSQGDVAKYVNISKQIENLVYKMGSVSPESLNKEFEELIGEM